MVKERETITIKTVKSEKTLARKLSLSFNRVLATHMVSALS